MPPVRNCRANSHKERKYIAFIGQVQTFDCLYMQNMHITYFYKMFRNTVKVEYLFSKYENSIQHQNMLTVTDA